MNIFSSLLFLHGHVTNAELARQLASPSPSPSPPPSSTPGSAGRWPAAARCPVTEVAGQRQALP
ncbi:MULTISPECIES: hypothetical protein [Stenotrophomonas]|uniref:hypothetical protein n=1 Tax=Stenotrophomonas maltophilia TaxID=40324 RepID=UPI002096EC61|nr:hypothetical protein [Stenotrophomonas maltophilia]MCO7461993.1 hypothetical protein [Stenotrophomonas maltophilia]